MQAARANTHLDEAVHSFAELVLLPTGESNALPAILRSIKCSTQRICSEHLHHLQLAVEVLFQQSCIAKVTT
jgi:hypothetical protein